MTFESLGLTEPLLKAVAEKGYTEPSPIQAKAIPAILNGDDVLASAQTGTGKTAGFTLPMLDLLTDHPPHKQRKIRALVLTPTRELAAQILDNVKDYKRFIDIRATVIFGGVKQNPQVEQLRKGVDVLVATPGRLLDLHGQGLLRLDYVEFLVLDEADRMLDMGFKRDIMRILDLLPQDRQNLLFSATFSPTIKELAHTFMYKPVMVEAQPENTTTELVDQLIYRIDKSAKTRAITHLIQEGNWEQVLIFTRTKHGANRLAQKLDKKGISSAAIHGDKSQGARTRALAGFKKGDIRVLVATDIAARGLDIPLLPHVVNFELPNEPEAYVHRIGRTGRAGANGRAISLVCEAEDDLLKDIQKLTGMTIPSAVIPGYEPGTAPPPQAQDAARNPRNNGRSRAGGGTNRGRGGGKPSGGTSRSGGNRKKNSRNGKKPSNA